MNLTFARLFLLLCSGTFCAISASIPKASLRRIESERSAAFRTNTWKKHFRAKTLHRLKNWAAKAQTHQNIRDYDGLEYVADVTVGNPPQTLTVILDTGSAMFWVPSSQCTSTFCISHRSRFNSQFSSTFRGTSNHFVVEYGDGTEARGSFGIDTMAFVTDGTNLPVNNQTFGLVDTINMDYPDDKKFDGILGLGFTALDRYNHTPPLIAAWQQGHLDRPIFTVWLPSRNSGENGQVTYGGLDPEHCGKVIAYEKLTEAAYWEIKVTSIGIKNSEIWQNAVGISDTGTSLFVGPENVIERIAVALNGQYDDDSGFYYVDCKAKTDPIIIGIGSNKYEIQQKNYVLDYKTTHGSTCVLAIVGQGGGAFSVDYILGDTFIRQYCQIYDIENEQIGFAPSLSNGTGCSHSLTWASLTTSFVLLAQLYSTSFL